MPDLMPGAAMMPGGGMPQQAQGPTAPMTVAPQSAGMHARGMVLVNIALNALDQAAGMLGSQSQEGQELMKALVTLRRRFGGTRRDLQQSEVKMLGESAPAIQQPTPQQGQAWQQAVRSRLGQMGMGGGAPPQAA